MKRLMIALALTAGASALLAAPPARKAAPRAKPAATTAAPRVSDWSKRVSVSPEGYFARGNPAAPVQLVEYASFTCPHCAAFAAEAPAGLDPLIAAGKVRLEFRPALRDPLDLAAAIVARCTGPQHYFDTAQALFADQERWFAQGADFAAKDSTQGSPAERLRRLAGGAGLDAIAARYGATPAHLKACFDDTAANIRLTNNAEAAWKKIKGTPSFFIAGEQQPAGSWAALEPLIAAKLKG